MLTNRTGRAKTVFVAMIAMLVGWGPPVLGQEARPIKISGSRYMFYNVTDFATSFLKNHPTVPDILVTSDSSLIAFKKLLDGKIDAYMSFRKLDEDERLEAQERGINLTEHIVGYGAVAIVTNPMNTVTELTVAQVRKLFSGEYLNWSQVGGPKMSVIPITRDESISGTELVFREIVLEGYPVAQHTIRQADHDISLTVRKEPGAIADARFTEALRGQKKGLVKIVAIKEHEDAPAVLPTEETVKNGTYLFSSPLYMYYDAKAIPTIAKQFMDFCAVNGLGTRISAIKEVKAKESDM